MIRFDKVCDCMAFDPDELSVYIKTKKMTVESMQSRFLV